MFILILILEVIDFHSFCFDIGTFLGHSNGMDNTM